MDNASLSQQSGKKNLWVLVILWALTFVIYLPAVKAGWVTDSVDWLYNIRNLNFSNYINNSQSGIPVLHQFTQFTAYLFYRIFHANPYAWHTLQVTMHAVNSFLLFIICSRLFDDSGIKNGKTIALWGVVLYTVCPHISEAIIWKAAFDYLLGSLLILLVLLWAQKFQKQQLKKYAWLAGITYLCATYSFEVFYLTPWFVLALLLYYRYVMGFEQSVFKKSLLCFFVPQLILVMLHLVLLGFLYSHSTAIGGNIWKPFSTYISKPPEYVFHILFLGRYFDKDTRKQVYEMLVSNAGMIIFYNIIVLICCYLFSKIRSMGALGKAGTLIFVWAMVSAVILMPLKFPETFLVLLDRYTYFLDAFAYMLLALLVSNITNKYIGSFLLTVYALLNLYFTVQVNLDWKHAAYIDTRILKGLPDPGNKIVVFLDLPQQLGGVPMIGAKKNGEYKKMYDLFVEQRSNRMYDVASYNMNTQKDGAHVIVINDSLVKVTLNQWATWWWYENEGAISYENEDYRLNMRDPGHWYELTLKHPQNLYLLVYQAGDQLKQVDWTKINVDQY